MKDDDPLLAKLGEVLRSRHEREGAPAPEARADSGDSPGGPGDEAMRREVFAPFSEKFRAGIVERSLRALAEGSTARSRPKRRRLAGGALGVVVALAAAGWLLWPGPRLPTYSLTVSEGDSAVRAPTGEPPGEGQRMVVTPGSQLDLLLRPATPIAGPLEARLYVVASPGATPTVAERSADVASSGSVRWSGTVRDLIGERIGDVELLLVVSRKSSQPDAAELARGLADRGRGWQSFRKGVRVLSGR